jgi:lysozyme family protein
MWQEEVWEGEDVAGDVEEVACVSRNVEMSEVVRLTQTRANTVLSNQINDYWDPLQANHMPNSSETENLICLF